MKFKEIKKRAGLFSALFLILLFTAYILLSSSQSEDVVESEKIVLSDKETIIEADKEVEEYLPLLNPVAVSIDNYPNNPNLKGIDESIVVYELPTEGGSSRFLAIYDNNNSSDFVVGPVRSLRKYFLDFSADFQALAVHCGGSPDALSLIAGERLSTLNEFYNGSYFKRDDSLKAPNNIYLKNSDWLNFLIDRDNKRIEENWLFSEGFSFNFQNYQDISEINTYYSPAYQSNWRYNDQLEGYIREPYDFFAKTLIFHFVDAFVIDDLLRLKFIESSEGPAKICYLGKCYGAIWKKEDKYRYYIEEQEILFEKDKVWINIMPDFAKLSF